MEKVFNYLKKILLPNDTIVIGVSTGPDSMCLLSILEYLNTKFNLHLKIIVCHINHNVRKESVEEEEYIKKYCNKHNLILEIKRLQKIEKNFESNARKERYIFFKEVVNKYNAKYLMTAHHGDDLIETILLRQIRGSVLMGYAGFPKETKYDNYTLVRPLVYVTKEDILKYLEENNIKYYNDYTNDLDNHIRNRIRHNILPILKKENPNIHLKFLEYSEEVFASDKILQNISNEITKKIYNNNRIIISQLISEDEVIIKRVIQNILKSIYVSLDEITSKHTSAIKRLMFSNRASGILNLPGNIIVIKEYDYLYFKNNQISREETENNIIKNTTRITAKKATKNDNINNNNGIIKNNVINNNINIQTNSDKNISINNNKNIQEKALHAELKEYNNYYNQVIKIINYSASKSNYVLRLDSKEIKLPLFIRTRKSSDKMFIKNFSGYKKVSDILINSKYPKYKRDTLLMVVDSNDEILWLPGVKKSKFDKEKYEKYDIILEYIDEGENL